MSKQSARTWFATLGGCFLGAAIVVFCIAIALVLYWKRDFLLGLAAPPPTPTRAATVTPFPPTPTNTPLPTLTATPHPAQAFAGPILAEIASRPPDYHDDFSDPSSGWEVGRVDNDICHGTLSYQDGKYITFAEPVRPEQYSVQGDDAYNYMWGSNDKLVPLLKDYVFEIEQTWMSGKGFTMIYLCDAEECYTIRIHLAGFQTGFWQENLSGDAVERFSDDDLLIVNPSPLGQPMRITFIKKGHKIAIYANGEPYYYLDLGNRPLLKLDFIQVRVLASSAEAPTEIHWDNLRIWDLSR